jgi:UDP-N-acetylglucosamine 2-epimerase (non-hydrolysing)
LDEGVAQEKIVMTGNTVIDALIIISEVVSAQNELIDKRVLNKLETGKRMVLVTAHRRENFGQQFQDICQAILRLADTRNDAFFVYPVHLNPNVQKPVMEYLGGHQNIILLPPLGYKSFIATLKKAYIVLTDSGGIQEEAPTLGVPVLVMRNTTERLEGIEAGGAALVGADPNLIFNKTCALLDNQNTYNSMSRASNPYGDGRASERIVRAILNQSPKDRQHKIVKPSFVSQTSKVKGAL